MLVCHQTTMIEGTTYERGDQITDPAIEAKILAIPHAAQNFSKRPNPAPVQPAWTPRVAAGPITED